MWQRILQGGSTSGMIFFFKIRHESLDASTTYFEIYDMNETLLYRDTTDTQYGQRYSFNKTYTLNGKSVNWNVSANAAYGRSIIKVNNTEIKNEEYGNGNLSYAYEFSTFCVI